MPEFIEKANNYIKMMITMKDRIIKNVFHNKDDNMVSLPVSFKYMIDNIKDFQNLCQDRYYHALDVYHSEHKEFERLNQSAYNFISTVADGKY